MSSMTGRSIVFWKAILVLSLILSSTGTIRAAPSIPTLQSPSIGAIQPESSDTPRVIGVSPAGGFLSDRSASVRITFSQPMDRPRTESSFSIQPDLPHKLTWDNSTTLQIEFSELFKPGIQYALTFSGEDAVDTAGQPLAEDYRWYYWLDPFDITSATPAREQVVLTFSAPLDQSRSGLPFEIQPPLEGDWKWQNNRTVVFNSSKPIPYAKSYTILINAPLYDRYGEIPLDEPPLSFTAPPPIRTVEPAEGEAVSLDFEAIKITFSEAVEKLSAQNAFTISPSIEGYFSWSRSGGSSFDDILSFTPNTLFQRGQTYTVSISPELKDRAGQPLILTPFRWTFTTDTYYSSYHAGASFGEYGYNVQVVDVNGPRRVQYDGKDPIRFEAYRYDLIDFVKLYSTEFGGGYSIPNISLPDPQEERLAAAWNATGHTFGGVRETIIPPEVPPGLYVLNMKHAGRSFSQLFLILTRNTVMAKLSGDQLFVWVTDINGDAVPNAEIRLYSARGEKLREGETDEQGIYRSTVPAGYQPMLVSATVRGAGNTDVSLTGLTRGWNTYDGWARSNRDPARYLVYTYTDRPIYKPGQTVYYKAMVRHDRDVRYSMPPSNSPVLVHIRDPRNNLLQSFQASLNEFGTLNGSFVTAEGAMLGNYVIEVEIGGETSRQVFRVEDYRKPEYQVTLAPSNPQDDNQLIRGETLDLDIDARYFFGEPVGNAKITYTYYHLYPYYDWWNPDPDEVQYTWYLAYDRGGNSTTKEDGKAQVRLWTDERGHFEYGYFGDWRSSLRTKTFAVEVTVDDGNNQPVSGYYIYTVANASEKMSLDTSGYFKSPNVPFSVQANVQDLAGKPVPLRDLSLEVHRWNRQTFRYDSTADVYALTTDKDGIARREIKLESGYYKLSLVGTDPLGNRLTYESWLSVFSERGGWGERMYGSLEISAEKDSYKPYETARFVIESGFDGPALLTFERGSVIHTQQVMLTAPLTLVETRIIPEYAPNVYVTVNAWEPTDRNDPNVYEYVYSNVPDSRLRVARTELQVPAETKALDITLTTDRDVYSPGDPITVDIEVRDGSQNPVRAEVSLALVDEAIFSLSHELSPAIFKAFYGPRPLSVTTYNSMSPSREIMVGGRGGGGDEASQAGVRSEFPDTAAWYPTLVTDADGRVSVTFNLPDNITSWRLSAKAVTRTHQVGEGRLNIQTKKDLLLRPLLPRVLTTGDQAHLTVMVHNYSDTARTVRVSLAGRNLQIQSDETQTLTIPAGGVTAVGWGVIPSGTTETQVTFTAIAGDGAGDAVQIPISIQPLSVRDIQSISGEFTGEISLEVFKPQELLTDNSQVILRLSRSPASSLLDGLEFLTGFPYGCVEQTMSRAMPNAVLGRASSQLGVGGKEFHERVEPLIHASIQKLYGLQHADGGWGWWLDDASEAYQSAWVLHGLAVIQSAGYPIEPNVIERAAIYLSRNLEAMDSRTRAYALYGMALAGRGNLAATRSLADASLRELDPFSQAALALALHQMGDVSRAEAILNVLESSAIRKGSYAYWPQDVTDGEYHRKTMASTVRTTAFVLSAILTIDGKDNPYAKPAAEYLVGKRNGYGWGTTNETSFTILALTDYLGAQQDFAGLSGYTVRLNGSLLTSGTLERGSMSVSFDIPLPRLRTGGNRLEVEGTGTSPLYYDLITRYAVSKSSVEAAGAAEITRRYLDPKTGRPVETIVNGQLVRVELAVRMPQPGSFILIEDHLPGGLEALNESLNTTSRAANYYDEYYDPIKYFWQDYGYNYKEIRGDRVTFFITDMKKGLTTISYLARATSSGMFTALPAEVSAMYDPLLWGRSSDDVVAVHDQR
jgi:alpha-2-macroglobulin